MPVIEENTGFIYCVEVNLDDVVVIRMVGLHIPCYYPLGIWGRETRNLTQIISARQEAGVWGTPFKVRGTEVKR